MMMQMLGAAGLILATDGQRAADEDNPRGYFELEAVKQIRRDPSFLEHAGGRVVKVVAPLLPDLPALYDYQVIFMQRDLDEVLASQRAMLRRKRRELDAAGEDASDEEALKEACLRQLRKIELWLEQAPNVRSVFVSHRRAIERPAAVAAGVARFLASSFGGSAMPGDNGVFDRRVERMAAVVDARMYRQRTRLASSAPPSIYSGDQRKRRPSPKR